jgi:hypothetical protein
VRVASLGLGYEPFLKWSVQDIDTAATTTSPEQQVRFSVNAIMNARRSLSCLADQYILRDCFAFCSDVPREANEKADLLLRRGIFDNLATQALRRAVERRNLIEHRYEQITLDSAQETVHTIRSSIENCVAKSDPYWAPGFFGSFLGGYSGGNDGETHHFDGWSGLLFVLARCESPPWFGVILPSSSTEAIVRKVSFSELTCNQLLEALSELEAKSSPGYSGYGVQTLVGQLKCLGLR